MRLIGRSGKLLLIMIALSTSVYGQQYKSPVAGGGPFSDVVLRAPFSATATTRVREVLQDGTVREDLVKAAYHRDSRGRVRAALDSPWGQYVFLWIPDPARAAFYVLDPASRTYRIGARFIATALFNGEGRVALPIGKACFRTTPPAVGASEMERLAAVNARTSADLGVVIVSRWSDQTVSVDYALTGIRRDEPPAGLFELPANYTAVTGSPHDPLVTLVPWNVKPVCVGQTR